MEKGFTWCNCDAISKPKRKVKKKKFFLIPHDGRWYSLHRNLFKTKPEIKELTIISTKRKWFIYWSAHLTQPTHIAQPWEKNGRTNKKKIVQTKIISYNYRGKKFSKQKGNLKLFTLDVFWIWVGCFYISKT